MRRVLAALFLTIAGVVMLLQYHVPPIPPVKRAIVAPVATARSVAAAPPRPKAAPKAPAKAAPTPMPSGTPAPVRVLVAAPVVHVRPATTAPRRTPAPTPMPSRVYTGTSFPACSYGDVQVQITVRGNRISDAKALSYPTDRQQSRYINDGPDGNDGAIAKLDSETVTYQTWNIDTVSGATCTSDGYINSLHAAFDMWKPGS